LPSPRCAVAKMTAARPGLLFVSDKRGLSMKYPILFGCLAAAFTMPTGTVSAIDGLPGPFTKTPIKHLVVIFNENISYDHYFGTYPHAMNLPGETPFTAKRHTPRNNNLVTPLDVDHDFRPLGGPNLLTNNPNANPNAPVAPNNSRHNGADAAN